MSNRPSQQCRGSNRQSSSQQPGFSISPIESGSSRGEIQSLQYTLGKRSRQNLAYLELVDPDGTVLASTDPEAPCNKEEPNSSPVLEEDSSPVPPTPKRSATTDRFVETCVDISVHTPTCLDADHVALGQLTSSPDSLPLATSLPFADELLVIEGHLDSLPVRVLIDGGAKGNFVNEETRKTAGLGLSSSPPRPLVLADGRTITSQLSPNCPLSIHGSNFTLDLLSAPLSYDVILGKPFLSSLNPSIDWRNNTITFTSPIGQLITWNAFDAPSSEEPPLTAKEFHRLLQKKDTRAFLCYIKDLEEFHQALDDTTSHQPAFLRQVLLDHEEVFSGVTGLPPRRPQDHRIQTLPDAKPPFQPLYHMSPQELALLKEELQRLLNLGHIQPSISPYGAPVFFVQEKTGKIRMVTDYRALNKITVKNNAPLPNIQELLDRLRDATIFTKIDLQSGFHLIRVVDEDVHKTAIRTKYGHFEFLVMPFGLCNAPATFQSTMNNIFRDFIDVFVIVYMDDLLIYSKTLQDHEKHLRAVLQRMQQHGLRARVHKCRFLQPEVDYLGFIVGKGVIRPDPNRIVALSSWLPPKDIHELRSFLGMANTLLRFTPMFAHHASILTDLLKGHPGKRDALDWQPKHQTAFDELKTVLTSPKVLHIPRDDLPIILHTDWSTQAIGGWISQEIEGEERPTAFESRKLRPAERNYSPYDGELLALIHCLRIFRPYLFGRKVLVRNDQKAL